MWLNAPLDNAAFHAPLRRGSHIDVPFAPWQSRYAQLVAVGCADGNVSFVDLSFTSQQPLFREARMVWTFSDT